MLKLIWIGVSSLANEVFYKNRLFKVLGVKSKQDLQKTSKKLGISSKTLVYYNDNNLFPDGEALHKILTYLQFTELELKLRLGILDNNIINWISENPELLLNAIPQTNYVQRGSFNVNYETQYGKLYQADCISLMKSMHNESVDMIFADPPFNLGKTYESGMNDYQSVEDYLEWTESWLLECIRILKPGGSIFVYNLPYWQTYTANVLNKYLTFRHWIAIYMRGLIPVARKLHPSHYGLLYYTKGEKPITFNKQRIPMETCRHCGGEIHDYGGKKSSLNELGLSISDVWTDIHPVRHKKFKNRESNELPLKLLHRVISLATNNGDLVFDPFGGSGTTYVVAEQLHRRWIGCEIGEVDSIISRLKGSDEDKRLLGKIQRESNVIFTEEQRRLRLKNNYWLLEDFK